MNSIPFTRKYQDLAQANDRRGPRKKLADDYAKVVDTAVEAEFDNAKIRYVATSTAGGAVTTNGTATATNTDHHLDTTHVKEIVDYMYQTMKCEPYTGDHYMAICASDAKRGIYDDVETNILKYTKYPATGEFGSYYDTRFVKTNHALSNTRGENSNIGEAYFFGAGGGPVCEGMAVAMEVVPKEVTDYGRSRGLAWYMIAGYKIFWSGDPDNNIVKFDSKK